MFGDMGWELRPYVGGTGRGSDWEGHASYSPRNAEVCRAKHCGWPHSQPACRCWTAAWRK
jgi:hypothetical protein